ncbi:signal peptide peptidase SppA [Candidatus Marinamargulisbacteria bacterium SCGC AG-343-D04]|nr:signal peptide peptidase SppA [Candidatus Marinamargulisbacteria bacterium SCGC AG-343-D04]
MKTIYIRISVFLLMSSLCYSQSLSVYEASKQIFSSRAMGMANAYTAVAEGEGAVWINPAGLSYPGGSYSYQYLDYDGLVYKQKQGHFFYNRPLGFSSIKWEDYNDNTLKMTALGFGVLGNKGISWGVNYKSLSGNIDGKKIEGWSSDLGLLFRAFPSLSLGITLKDVYSKNLDIDSTYNLGMAGFLFSNTLMWSLENEYNTMHGRVSTTKLGAEYVLSDSLTLRSGVHQSRLFFGTTFNLSLAKFDFSASNDPNDTIGTHYTLAAKLGAGTRASHYRKRYALFKKSSYAEFSIGKNLKQGKSEISLFGGSKIGSNDLLSLIHLANEDPSCSGYIIRVGSLSSSISILGFIEELRDELQAAKDNDKKVFIYVEGDAGLSEYYLASIGDVIIMPPLGSFGQIGLQMEIQKAADVLEKFGIKTTVFSSGTYKSSTGLFSKDLSAIEKKQLTDLVQETYKDVMQKIEESRTQAIAGLLHVSDGKIITAKKALELDFVDQLAYWPEVYSIVDEYEEGIEKIALSHFYPYRQPSIFNLLNRIAVLEVDGPIMMGMNSTNFLFGGSSTGADEFDEVVDSVKSDRTIKGVILRINSPGGSVLAADRMYEAVERLKKSGKLVYSSMGTMATSGGYYVAMNSDKIYANKSTLTGSVGVISKFTSLATLGEELGVKRTSIKTGKYMDLYSSNKVLTTEEAALIQAHQDQYYQEFVNKVKRSRMFTEEELYSVSQGQIVTGKQALDYKMIDSIGSLYSAIDDMAKVLEIDDPNVTYVRKKSRFQMPGYDSGVLSKFNMFRRLAMFKEKLFSLSHF